MHSRKLRIAVIVESFPKLSETFVINHIKGLLDANLEVNIFAFNYLTETKVHEAVLEYQLEKITRYRPALPKSLFHRLFKGVYIIITHVWTYPKPVLQALNFFRHGKQVLSLERLFDVSIFLTKDEFDLAHCHFGPIGEKVALFKNWGIMKCPLVTSFHGYDANTPGVYGKNFYRLLPKVGNLFLANTNFTRNNLLELNFPERHIRVIPAVPDLSFFTRERSSNANLFTVVSIGRLVELKGMYYAVLAMRILRHHYKLDFKFLIVGEGPLKVQLESLIKESGLSEQVELLGGQTQREIHELLTDAHVFLYAGIRDSNGREEAQGLVIQEAQAMELPVVVSNIGGVADGMIDNETGFLIPEKDVNLIAERLYMLKENPELRLSMGKRGREFVNHRYNLKQITDDLIDTYEKLL